MIEKQITDIINNHVIFDTIDCIKKRRYQKILHKDISFCLVDDGVDKYNNLIKQLQKRWNGSLSEGYVNKAIQELIGDAIKDECSEVPSQYIEQLVAIFEHDSSQRQTVYLPLAVIQMEFETLEIGKFTFKKIDDAFIDELLTKIIANLPNKTMPVDKERALSALMPFQKGNACAEYHTIAERGAAKECALRELQKITDLLIYCAYSLYPMGVNFVARLRERIVSGVINILVISPDGCWTVHLQSTIGTTNFLTISAKNIEKMNNLGFSEVSHILRKSNDALKPFERTLLRGIHWFATSQLQYEKAAEFICLTTCLETFLNPRDDSPKSTSIAEGTAILLSTTLNGRQELKNRIKKIYGLRSAVIHGDEPSSLDIDLPYLRSVARKLVELMIKRQDEFIDQRALVKWIEKCKLSHLP